MSLIPYLTVAAYALKLGLTRETYEHDTSTRNRELIIALIATAYAILMLVAGGLDKLLAALILVPGTLLFFLARREQRLRIFTPVEWFVFTVAAIAAIAALVGLISGQIAF